MPSGPTKKSLASSIVTDLSASRLAPVAPVEHVSNDANSGRPFARALVLTETAIDHEGNRSVARELVAGLEARGVPAELCQVDSPSRARAQLALLHSPTDLVLCACGPEVLAQVIANLPSRSWPLACLPLTDPDHGEHFERSIGLPRDVDSLLELVFAKHFQPRPFAWVESSQTPTRNILLTECISKSLNSPLATSAMDATSKTSTPAGLRVWLDGRELPGRFSELRLRPAWAWLPQSPRDSRALADPTNSLQEEFTDATAGHMKVRIQAGDADSKRWMGERRKHCLAQEVSFEPCGASKTLADGKLRPGSLRFVAARPQNLLYS